MKIAFPVQEFQELDSQVYGHFGSAAGFVVVDSDSNQCQAVDNRDREHQHGQCRPIDALGGQAVDAVVVGGIGRGALMKLNSAGVKTYRAVEGSVRDNLDLFKAGKLLEFTPGQTCAGHSHDGQCGH